MLDHALIDAFETAADEDRAFAAPGAHAGLRELLSARREKKARAPVVRRKNGVEIRGQNIGAQHHARAAASRRIVYRAMTPESLGAKVCVSRLQTPRARASPAKKAERARKHFGEEREECRAPDHQAASYFPLAGRVGPPRRFGVRVVTVDRRLNPHP